MDDLKKENETLKFKIDELTNELNNLYYSQIDEDITLDDAITEFGNKIYSAALYLEKLESKNKIRGNGHSKAQKISQIAVEILKESWNKK